MMFTLIFDKQVEKFIKKQDKKLQLRIRDALLELAENPYQVRQVKRLKGREN